MRYSKFLSVATFAFCGKNGIFLVYLLLFSMCFNCANVVYSCLSMSQEEEIPSFADVFVVARKKISWFTVVIMLARKKKFLVYCRLCND
jgi:hypothetical protein